MAATAKPKRDMDRVDIVYALKKAGWSLSALSRQHHFHPTAASTAINRRWRAMETIIAKALGKPPQEIWPSRYP